MTEFTTIARPKAYVTIVDQLVERIAEGALKAGDRLPPERELARVLGVSRATLKEAIRVMEHAGVVEVRPGSGTYVAGAVSDKGVLLRAQAETQGDYSPLDVIVARRSVEPTSAQLACIAGSPSDHEAIRIALEEQANITRDGADPMEADFQFHLAIASASKNAVLLRLTEQLIDFMRQPAWLRLKRAARETDDAAHQFLDEHVRVYEAIQQGDGHAAARAMSDHLLSIERGLRAKAGVSA
jgi:GntR family transcriptional regulator, transcriptional repressor for pyruvate dehydrogenase complex